MESSIEIINSVVRLEERTRLFIGWNAREHLLKSVKPNERTYFVVTHPTIQSAHADFFMKLTQLLDEGVFCFPEGESEKNWQGLERILSEMFKRGLRRDGCVIIIGGGVLGDVGGLAAALYMRGLEVWQVPTTLLAMVDSSIGGKTAVDMPWGKNLIGIIRQPSRIYCDPIWLETLPEHEWRNGLGEIVKYGMLTGEPYLSWLETHLNRILRRDSTILTDLISPGIRYKLAIIQSDPLDSGKRHVLNLGHTVGHALERMSEYRLAHGQAVLLGLIAESYIAQRRGLVDFEYLERVKGLVNHILTKPVRMAWLPDIFWGSLLYDKKQKSTPDNQTITMALPVGPGDVRVYDDIDTSDVQYALERLLNDEMLYLDGWS